jgi:drug/metabolite transporter (DMT)-like permease
MLAATLLALASAGLHAAWNLVAKRSADRFVALWGQFAAAGLIGAVALAVTGGLAWRGWAWAALSGAIHTPYLVGLARAYDHGDFSVAYPLARGGGALAAAVGGVALLDDRLGVPAVLAIATAVAGMSLLSLGAHRPQVVMALFVAITIGAYTTVDSHASRSLDAETYVCAGFVMSALGLSAYGVATRRLTALRASAATAWPQYVGAGAMSLVAYACVLLAVRRAPVGYVAALRESSVLLAVLLGWRYLDEGRVVVRSTAAGLIAAGLVLLVVTG